MKMLREKLIKIFKSVLNRIETFRSFLLTSFIVAKHRLNQWRLKLSGYFDVNSRNIARAFIFVLGIVLASISYQVFPQLNDTALSSLSNGFFAIGSMMGGIIAIVYSLTNFLQESVEDMQSSAFYERYIHDTTDKSIYGYLAFLTIQFIFMGIITAGSTVLNPAIRIITSFDVFLLALALILLDMLHQISSRKVNPNNALKYLKNECLQFINKVKQNADSLSKVIQVKNSIPHKTAEKFVYSILEKNNYVYLFENLKGILEISRQLAIKNKVIAVNNAIDAIEVVLIQYLQMRADNSTIHISDVTLLSFESDSQSLLTQLMEDINRFAIFLITTDNEPSSVRIIKLYERLIRESFNQKYSDDLVSSMYGNPISQQLIWYFRTLLEDLIRKNSTEAIFQAANALSNIAILAPRYTDDMILSSVLDPLEHTAIWGLTNHQSVVTDVSLKCFLYTSHSLLFSDYSTFEHNIETTLELLFKYIALIQKTNQYPYYRLTLIRIFTEYFREVIVSAINNLNQKDGVKIENLLQFFEELADAFRDYARESQQYSDQIFHVLGDFLAYLYGVLFTLLEGETDKDITTSVHKSLTWFAHLLPFFANNKSSLELNNYHSLFEATTFIGVKAIQSKGSFELVSASVDSLCNMLNKFVDSSIITGSYDEEHAIIFLVYLGILSHKFEYPELTKKIGEYLNKYEELYYIKRNPKVDLDLSGSIENKLSIVSVIWEWRDSFNQHRFGRILHDELSELLEKLIEVKDIDSFIFHQWQVCDDLCSLKSEHEAIIHPK